MTMETAKGKGFRLWVAADTKVRAKTLEHAVAMLVPPLESAGFRWVDKSFDCGVVPAHTINLEREIVPNQIDYVQLIFDKRRRLRFQVLFGSKEKKPPHRWIRSGALVWKRKSDSVEYKWWGARWWQLDRKAALADAAKTAAALVPQLLHFLSKDVAGNNIWAVTLNARSAGQSSD